MKNEFNDGFIANIPIAISVFAYGSVLGMLCVQKDISVYELVLMNVFILLRPFLIISCIPKNLNSTIYKAFIFININ